MQRIYQAYTLDLDDELIGLLFEARFGYPPSEIIRDGAIAKVECTGTDADTRTRRNAVLEEPNR